MYKRQVQVGERALVAQEEEAPETVAAHVERIEVRLGRAEATGALRDRRAGLPLALAADAERALEARSAVDAVAIRDAEVARAGAEILGRSTTQTSWLACDRIPGTTGGRVFMAEYHDVFGPPNCFRDGRESLTVLRKRSGVRTILAARIDAAEGLDECRDDYEPVEDLQVSPDGTAIFASLSTGVFRLMPGALQITPDFNELFQLHPDGSVVITTASDQGSVGVIRVYKIAPEQAVNGAVRLSTATPCGTLSVPNNGGRTVINYPTALGGSAGAAGDATLVVSFLTTGGTSDRTGRTPVLPSKLRFQGTAAFSVPAGATVCPSLGILNLDLMELLTF